MVGDATALAFMDRCQIPPQTGIPDVRSGYYGRPTARHSRRSAAAGGTNDPNTMLLEALLRAERLFYGITELRSRNLQPDYRANGGVVFRESLLVQTTSSLITNRLQNR